MDARISACGQYRYTLSRGSRLLHPMCGPAVFCMLNPSTADATLDDPTIRRCRGFADSWDCAGIIVVNLYALRSTDPSQLWRHDDAVGSENDEWLANVALHHKSICCAWGTNAKPERVRKAVEIFRDCGATLMCLGTTKDGHPRHPLYVRADAKAIEWKPQ